MGDTETDHTLLCSEFVLAYIIINRSILSLHLRFDLSFCGAEGLQ